MEAVSPWRAVDPSRIHRIRNLAFCIFPMAISGIRADPIQGSDGGSQRQGVDPSLNHNLFKPSLFILTDLRPRFRLCCPKPFPLSLARRDFLLAQSSFILSRDVEEGVRVREQLTYAVLRVDTISLH